MSTQVTFPTHADNLPQFPAPAITIRPARRSDSRFIYDLSSDPRIRSASARQEEFSFEDHQKWYEGKLTDRLNAIWVMEVGGIPVGQVRYGRTAPAYRNRDGMDVFAYGGELVTVSQNGAEVAISIVPHEWRRGFALTLLRETMLLACEWLRVDTLVALVLRTNYASRKLFRRAGFKYVGAEVRMDRCHARYEVTRDAV